MRIEDSRRTLGKDRNAREPLVEPTEAYDAQKIESQLDAAVHELELKIGIEFADKEGAKTVLVTSVNRKGGAVFPDSLAEYAKRQHKLETIGDGILDGYIYEYVAKNYPEWSEERRKRLRNFLNSNMFLSIVGMRLGLDELVFVPEFEVKTQTKVTKPRFSANVLEGLVAYIERDQGEEKLDAFITKYILLPFPGNKLMRAFVNLTSNDYRDIRKGLFELVRGNAYLSTKIVETPDGKKRCVATIAPARPAQDGEFEPIQSVQGMATGMASAMRIAAWEYLKANPKFLWKANGPLSLVPQRRVRFPKF